MTANHHPTRPAPVPATSACAPPGHAAFGPLRYAATALIVLLLGACGGGGGGGADDGEISRSPQWVVFVTDSPRAVYATLDDGSGAPVELSAGLVLTSRFPVVSPDNARVLMQASVPTDNGFQNYVRNVDGSGLVRISNFTTLFTNVFFGEWSPDGSGLFFLADGDIDEVYELYRVDRDGTNQEKVNDPLFPGESISEASWSPNGRYIAFTIRTGTAGSIAIGVHDSQTDTRVRIPVSENFSDVKWSPTSEKLAYIRRDTASAKPAHQMYTVNPDGTDHLLSNGSLGGQHFLGAYEWSPDGRWLAQLFRMREDFSINKHAKAFVNVYDLSVPLSTRVVEFPLVNPSSTIPSNFGECFDLCKFGWSWRGTELAYLSNNDSFAELEVYSYNVADDISRKLNDGFADIDIRSLQGWTSNDRYLVYEGGIPGNTRSIAEFADPASPDPAVRISETGNRIRSYEWSPDHERLFATRVAGDESIVEVREQSSFGTAREILSPPLPSSDYLLGEIHLSADGENLVYVAIDLANAFIQELRSTPVSGGPATRISGNLDVVTVRGY